VWQQRFEAISNSEGPHYQAGMAAMAEYAQGLFNLQHSTDTTVVQQRLCMEACEERYTATSWDLAHPWGYSSSFRAGPGFEGRVSSP
jgi:hypothetical protein